MPNTLPLARFGAIIIGDEILSGKRQDKHLPQLIALLAARGCSLAWAEYVGDERGRLTDVLRRATAGGDIVFSFGGIGATPDDHTRQCAAAALDVALQPHAQAQALITQRMQEMATEKGEVFQPERADNVQRLQMGVLPAGAQIIPNPFNRIPGFSCRGAQGAWLHCVPGFPVMAWPMVEWVLDTRYPHLHHAEDYVEQAITVWDAYEGQLIGLMRTLTEAFPDTTLFSLPTIAGEGQRRSLELGMKGTAGRVAEAMVQLKAGVTGHGFQWEDKT